MFFLLKSEISDTSLSAILRESELHTSPAPWRTLSKAQSPLPPRT